MRREGMSALAAASLAAGLLVVGAPVHAQPRQDAAIRPGAGAAADGMFRQRKNLGVARGAGTPYFYPRYQGFRRAELGRPRLRRFRRRYAAPYAYYYYSPPVTYYTSPPVAYYSAPASGYYYIRHHGRRHHRYRVRVAGYRARYTARTPPGWRHGRKRGWYR